MSTSPGLLSRRVIFRTAAHLTHAAYAERGLDFVGTDLGTKRKRHLFRRHETFQFPEPVQHNMDLVRRRVRVHRLDAKEALAIR